MLSWEEIVQYHVIKYSDQTKKVTRPLHDHFRIHYFTYHRIDNEGNYTVLLDRPEWAEYYVENKIFLNDPYLRHPQVYQSGICSIENVGSEEYKKTILIGGKKILNLDFGVMLIIKTPNYVEFFGFAGNKATSSLQKICLNQSHLLKSFALHFKEELKTPLAYTQKEVGSLLILKGQDFFCNQPISPGISPSFQSAYLKDLGLGIDIQKFEKLTLRERECLKWLIEEKSAKETAVLLGLSQRTVESYFENIKNKLSCWCKQEVRILAKKFAELGLL